MNAENHIGYYSTYSDSARYFGGFSVLNPLNHGAGMRLNGESSLNDIAQANVGTTVPLTKRRKGNPRRLPNGARPHIDAGWPNRGDKRRKATSNRKVISNKELNPQDIHHPNIV